MQGPDPVPPPPFHLLIPAEIQAALDDGLAAGGAFSEIFVERRVARQALLEEGRLRSIGTSTEVGAGLRVLSGEGTGYAYTCDPSAEAIRAAARVAGRIARAGGTGIEAPVPPGLPAPVAHGDDPGPGDPGSLDSRLAWLEEVDRLARRADPRVVEVVASVAEERRTLFVANSRGLLAHEEQPLVRVAITAFLRSGSGATWRGQYGGGGRSPFDLLAAAGIAPRVVAEEAVRRARLLVESVEAPAGEMPVVIGNGWGGVLLHEAVGHGFEADFVRRGTSIFTGRLGERVASGICTVIDDGTIPGGRGSFAIDDEGTPSQRTVLIEDGILCGYLHDLLSASRLRSAPTGNGRRHSFRTPPIPRQSNLFMEAAGEDPEEILRSVPRGLYARGLGSGQVDIVSGNFVFEVTEGYLIEEGRVSAPVRGANLIGSGPRVLGAIERVGSDLALDPGMGTCGKEGQSQPVGVGQPTILVRSMVVGGTRL